MRRRLGEARLRPELRRQEGIGTGERLVASLNGVTKRSGVTTRAREHVFDTRHLKHLLRGSRGDNTGTTRRRDEANVHGTALAVNLARHGVRGTELGAPVTTANRDDVQLRENHRTLNGVRDFLARLDAQTDVAVAVTDDDESLRH